VVLLFSIFKVYFPRNTMKMNLILNRVFLCYLSSYLFGFVLSIFFILPIGEIITIIFLSSALVLQVFLAEFGFGQLIQAATCYTMAFIVPEVCIHRQDVLCVFNVPQRTSYWDYPLSIRLMLGLLRHLRHFLRGFWRQYLSMLVPVCPFSFRSYEFLGNDKTTISSLTSLGHQAR
jgi:hypothetical protein